MKGWIDFPTAKALCEAAGQDLAALKKAAIRRDFQPGLACRHRPASRSPTSFAQVQSQNVVARLEGSDPALKDEYVVYTAHWDHLGRDPKLKGDQIYNGAADNASGVATVLEIARAFTRDSAGPQAVDPLPGRDRRGEGPARVQVLRDPPAVSAGTTLANINIDVINFWGKTSDVISIGMGQSSLDDLLVEVARAQGRTVGPDAEPEKGYYYRSDHFEFAKQGVPALDPKAGQKAIGKPADYAKKKQDEYTEKDYHKVSDEVKPDWDLSGAVEDCQVAPRSRLSRGRGRSLPRMEAGQRVPRPPRGHAQGRQAMIDELCTAFAGSRATRRPRVMSRAEHGLSLLALFLAALAVARRLGRLADRLDHARRSTSSRTSSTRSRCWPGSAGRLSSCWCDGTWRSARRCWLLGLLLFPRLGRHGRPWLAIFWVGYAIRATVWICGGNLPLVPGDSCHYLEVATSVFRGEGPVKHYVESFFTDYPRIRQGQGVLDDWATPLDAYLRAVGLPAGRHRARAVARGHRRRRQGVQLRRSTCWPCRPSTFSPGGDSIPRWRSGAMGVLAVLPVHAIYAGFVLRESLVALTAILAVWTLTEIWHAPRAAGRAWAWAVLAGPVRRPGHPRPQHGAGPRCRGRACTPLPRLGRRRPGPSCSGSRLSLAVILPWAVATTREYGTPFYTYTSYFEYNFSWTVHHLRQGEHPARAVLHAGRMRRRSSGSSSSRC